MSDEQPETRAGQDEDGPRPDDAGERLEAVLAGHREPAADEPETENEPYDPFAPPRTGDAGEDPHEDRLPDAPLFALLRRIEEEVTPARIDRAWIFPPRRIEARETAVVVVTVLPETDDDRRRVFAAHYTAIEDRHQLALDEYGSAPTERAGRLVEEVVDRIKDGPTAPPRSIRIEGREQRWYEALHELAEEFVELRLKGRR